MLNQYFISKVLSPFIKLLSVSTNILRLFKIDTNVDEEITSEEEIIFINSRTGQATGL